MGKANTKRKHHKHAVERLSPRVNAEHQQAVNAWLRRNTVDGDKDAIFFTLKFHRKCLDDFGKTGINEAYAIKLVSKWLNRLDRTKGSKRAIRAGHRIERVVFKHKGFNGENIHFHGVLLIEGDVRAVLADCKNFWKQERGNGWVDYQRSVFEVAQSNYAVSHYSAHEVYKLGVEDSWVVEQTHMNNNGVRIAKDEAARRTERTQELRKLRLEKEAREKAQSHIEATI